MTVPPPSQHTSPPGGETAAPARATAVPIWERVGAGVLLGAYAGIWAVLHDFGIGLREMFGMPIEFAAASGNKYLFGVLLLNWTFIAEAAVCLYVICCAFTIGLGPLALIRFFGMRRFACGRAFWWWACFQGCLLNLALIASLPKTVALAHGCVPLEAFLLPISCSVLCAVIPSVMLYRTRRHE